MLQLQLDGRLRLQFHRESKELLIYSLVVQKRAENSLRLKANAIRLRAVCLIRARWFSIHHSGISLRAEGTAEWKSVSGWTGLAGPPI
jgi:hypothetical protein